MFLNFSFKFCNFWGNLKKKIKLLENIFKKSSVHINLKNLIRFCENKFDFFCFLLICMVILRVADSGCKVNKELALSPVNSIFHRHEEHVQKEL